MAVESQKDLPSFVSNIQIDKEIRCVELTLSRPIRDVADYLQTNDHIELPNTSSQQQLLEHTLPSCIQLGGWSLLNLFAVSSSLSHRDSNS